MQVCLLASLLLWTAKAKIVEDGLWTGKTFSRRINSPDEYTVENGQVTFLHEAKKRHVKSANMKQLGEYESIYEQENVELVNKILDREFWNFLFPNRVRDYDYESFLGAVARYPAFCGEATSTGYSLEETCKRELSTLFAHMIFETGGYRERPATQNGYFDEDTFFAGLTQDRACVYEEIR